MENWNQIEVLVLLWIQEHIRTEWLNKIMVFLSTINDSGEIAIATVVLLLLWRRYRHVGVAALISLVAEFAVVNIWLKNMVQRTRPYFVNEALTFLGDMPEDFSFPSGHTGSTFAVAIVMYLCMPKKYGVSALVVATLISLSRIYNGAHYPTDVLGALMIALVTGIMAWKWVFPAVSKRMVEMGAKKE